jgi:intracellular multiplication protein IcmO
VGDDPARRDTAAPAHAVRPARRHRPDPDPETGEPRRAQGLDHLGAEVGTRRQVWHGKDDVAQHTAIPGTTGAGKTEALIALAVVNALVQGTGCVFVDGKADRKLYAKVFALARRYGREDDVFVWNFLTLDGRDSMTCNPFGPASADMIREILVGQLTEPGQQGNGGVFFSRAVGFLGAIAPVLTWMRDEHGIPLDLEKIRDATELSNVVLLATKRQIKFTDSATGASELLEFPDMPAALVQTLRSYLGQTGGFDLDVSLKEQRSQQPSEQHSYITMQFTEVFSQWLVSLGHIFKVRTGDVDMLDVVLQRRILVVILPSLENSDKTNAGLGKIVVAMLRSMMALTLGSKLEGDYQEIVGNRPSEAFAPFKVVFDELAYYVTAGMDGMLAQGRGLGLHFLLGFQEAAGLAARIGEKMWSLLGNANLQVIMRLQDGNQTRTYVEKTAGEAHVTQSTSYSSASDLSDAHVASDHAEVRQVSRVNWLDVRALRPGQAIVLFQNSRVYTQVFYAPVKLAGMIRRNKPSMLDRLDAADLRRQFARTVGVRRAVVEGQATAQATVDSSPVLDGLLAELRRALAGAPRAGERPSPVEAALAAVLSCPGERMPTSPVPGLADADEGDEVDAAEAMSGTADAERATGTEPGSRSGVAPAPEDHAFSDLLRQVARERDVPLATFTDPGVVAPADRELAHALVLVERAGGQNARQAKLAVRQLLAERDRVLREPVAMALPPVAPEKLAGVIRSLAATLEQGATASVESAQTEPARLGAAGPA